MKFQDETAKLEKGEIQVSNPYEVATKPVIERADFLIKMIPSFRRKRYPPPQSTEPFQLISLTFLISILIFSFVDVLRKSLSLSPFPALGTTTSPSSMTSQVRHIFCCFVRPLIIFSY